MPSGVRRTAFATLGTSLVALATTTIAHAGNGGFLKDDKDWDQLIDVLEHFSTTLPASASLILGKKLDMGRLLGA